MAFDADLYQAYPASGNLPQLQAVMSPSKACAFVPVAPGTRPRTSGAARWHHGSTRT